jgi:hypothetical protein
MKPGRPPGTRSSGLFLFLAQFGMIDALHGWTAQPRVRRECRAGRVVGASLALTSVDWRLTTSADPVFPDGPASALFCPLPSGHAQSGLAFCAL